MAPKLMTMNIHLNLTNVSTSAWKKTCAEYSVPLYNSWLQNHTPVGHRTRRDVMQTLLVGIGAGSGTLNAFDTETLANKLSVLEEMKAGVTGFTNFHTRLARYLATLATS